MRVIIQNDYEKLSLWAARHIAKTIKDHQKVSYRPFILGLPTGSSPIGTYKELIRLNKAGYISFKNVITFNMDEYVGLPRDHEQSYWTFMHENFFNHIDIPTENINMLNGNAEDVKAECARYEEKIKSYGGIDLFLGGALCCALKKWMRNPFNKYKKEHSKAEMVQNYITENKLG